MRVLAIGAHPDDLEILCAGTLAKYISLGHEVIMCHVGSGDMGHMIIEPDELKVIRRNEAISAANIIGAKSMTLEIRDGFHFEDEAAVMKYVDMFREANPDLIITHAPEDYMPDHITTSNLVMHASFNATFPHLHTAFEMVHGVIPVYFMDTLTGLGFTPTEFVDISDFLETKINMLKCHDSQIAWLRDHSKFDMLDAVTTSAKYRGYQCGVTYAEGFRPANMWLRQKPERLLP